MCIAEQERWPHPAKKDLPRDKVHLGAILFIQLVENHVVSGWSVPLLISGWQKTDGLPG